MVTTLTRFHSTGFLSVRSFEGKHLLQADTINRTTENGFCGRIAKYTAEYLDQRTRIVSKANTSVKTTF